MKLPDDYKKLIKDRILEWFHEEPQRPVAQLIEEVCVEILEDYYKTK